MNATVSNATIELMPRSRTFVKNQQQKHREIGEAERGTRRGAGHGGQKPDLSALRTAMTKPVTHAGHQ